MKIPTLLLAFAAATAPLTFAPLGACAAQAAPSVTSTLPPAELAALKQIRKDVWVHWFAGDTAALHRVLAPELIAISPDSRLWQTLPQTLAGSAGFKASGQKLVSVMFDSDVIHRFGDVVVMFSRYTVVTEGSGRRETQAGRATEVFVKSKGRWVHTSWHLDVRS